jgi:hypothetical protein
MKDDIFWGNLLGLLKHGKWQMSLEEASAFIQVYQEAARRSRPVSMSVTNPSPIKESKGKKK